jgi:hypothetical protein
VTVPVRQAGQDRSEALTSWQSGQVIIYENACGQSSYVCALVHYAREPQLHAALPRRARQQRDGAPLDGDDARRHGGERRLSDDAPAPDASVLVPSWSFSLL